MIGTQDAQKANFLFEELKRAARDCDRRYDERHVDWFAKGLQPKEIASHELRLGIDLPTEYKAMLQLFDGLNQSIDLTINGRADWTGFDLQPVNYWRCPEQEGLIKEFFYEPRRTAFAQQYSSLPIVAPGAVKRVPHDYGWVCLNTPGAWYDWYADFSPELGGVFGQVLFVTRDTEKIEINVISENYFEFMEIIIESIDAQ